jgi:hypothetical protein
MRPERPECQCLDCAQLQHQQANDTLLLVAIATVVVIGGLVWLARLRNHAGDPAAAWPASVRGLLPGPLGMYVTLAAILATPLALGLLAWWVHQPPSAPRPPATLAPRSRRALPPATHPDVPMLPPPEDDREVS